MIVSDNNDGIRLDKYLSLQYSEHSRSYLKNLISDGKVTVNGKEVLKGSFIVSAGDEIEFELPPVQELSVEEEDIPLDILYEDNDVLVINKPKNMVVHPAAGHSSGTLVNAVLFHCKGNLSGINGVLRPGIVHRIDKDTTGSVIICKNDKSHQIILFRHEWHLLEVPFVPLLIFGLKSLKGLFFPHCLLQSIVQRSLF